MKTIQKLRLAERQTFQPMFKPPQGWFKAALNARDSRSMADAMIEDNIIRNQRGLPTYEPTLDFFKS